MKILGCDLHAKQLGVPVVCQISPLHPVTGATDRLTVGQSAARLLK